MSIQGADLSDLMIRWLGEILFLFQGEGEIVSSADVETIIPSRLEANLGVTPFRPELHEISRDIKAVTYHQGGVYSGPGGWEARVILDV